MPWNRIETGRGLASTYQQVLENMRYIQETILPKIDILNDTVFNPDNTGSGGNSDLIVDVTNQMKVIGVTIVRDKMDENTPPSAYSRNVTYELKETAVVDLAGKEGITLDHVLIKTIAVNDADDVDYPAWQTAYGDVEMTTYFRKAESDDTWGDWIKVVDMQEILEKTEILIQQMGHKQFIQSDNQPKDDVQEVGDYWMQPLYDGVAPDAYFLQSVTDSSIIYPITDLSSSSYQFESIGDGDTTPSPGMGDFDLDGSGTPYPTSNDPNTNGETI